MQHHYVLLVLVAAAAPAAHAQTAPDLLFPGAQNTMAWNPTQPEGALDNVLADLDGDGALDHVAAMGKGTLRIALGTGGGGFGPSAEVAIAVGTTALAVRQTDIDADGDVDLLVLGRAPGTLDSSVFLLKNDGTGGFAPPVETPVGRQAWQAWLADFDGDGDVDVAVPVEGAVAVLLSDGTGAFQVVLDPDLSYDWTVAADFDGDGAPDLAARTIAGLECHLNAGTGTFLPPVTTPYGESAGWFEAGDFDNDGLPDVVGAILAPLAENVSLQATRSVGGGVFAPGPVVVVSESERPSALRPADTDGDGNLDVVLSTIVVAGGVTPEDPPALVWARGDGALGFTGSAHVLGTAAAYSPEALHGLALGDVDGDSALDAVVAIGEQYFVTFPGDGTGDFFGAETVAKIAGLLNATLADLDGDGYLDLAGSTGAGELATALGDGDGGFGPPQVYDAGQAVGVLTPLDWDGDLNLDLLGVAEGVLVGGPTLVLFRGDGAGGIASSTALVLGKQIEDALLGDFDRDGVPDAVLLHSTGGSLVQRDALGGLAAPLDLDLCQSGECTAIQGGDAGDVDLDGALDLVLARFAGVFNPGRVDTYFGDGLGGFTFGATTDLGGVGTDVLLGDLSSDGLLDLVSVGLTNGARSALGDGTGAFTLHETLGTEVLSTDFSATTLTDVDGDGRLDLLSGYGGVRLGDGTGALPLQGVYPFPGFGLFVGDVDADGVRDVVRVNANVNEVYLTQGLRGCAGEIAPYGLASPASGGFAPSLVVTGCAAPGGTVRAAVEHALGGAPAVLALGLAEAHLPFPNGYELLVSQVVSVVPLALSGAVPGAGAAEVVASLGAAPPGAFAALQAFVVDPGVPGWIATSNGTRIVVQ